MKHTPGPWTFEPADTDEPFDFVVVNKQYSIAGVIGGLPEVKANARLIATAPDLLTSAKNMMTLLAEVWDELPGLVAGGPDSVNAAADALADAITKAEGNE